MDLGGFPSSPPPRRRRNAMADITACGEAHIPPQHGYASYAPTAMRQHPQPTFEQQYHHNYQAFQHPAHYGVRGHYTGAALPAHLHPTAQQAHMTHTHGQMPDVDMDLGMSGLHIGEHAGAAGAGHGQPFGYHGVLQQQQQQQQQPDGFVFPGGEVCMGGMGSMGAPLLQQYSGDSDALSCGSDTAQDFHMEMRPASRRGSRRDSRRNAVSAEDQAAIMAHFGGM